MDNLEVRLEASTLTEYTEEISLFVHEVFKKAYERNLWEGNYDAVKADDQTSFPHSATIVVRAATGNMLFGTIKAIFDTVALLPIERDFGIVCHEYLKEKGLPSGRVAEIARLAVNHSICRTYGVLNNDVSLLLLEKICLAIKSRKISYCFASIDENVWRWLVRIGFPFEQIGEARFYLGSNTVPVLMKTAEISSPLWELCDNSR